MILIFYFNILEYRYTVFPAVTGNKQIPDSGIKF